MHELQRIQAVPGVDWSARTLGPLPMRIRWKFLGGRLGDAHLWKCRVRHAAGGRAERRGWKIDVLESGGTSFSIPIG